MKPAKIFGIHSVRAALDYSAATIVKAWADANRQDKRVQRLIADIRALGITLEKADRKKLDDLAGGNNHQGVVVEIPLPALRSEEQFKQAATAGMEPPFFLILDQVQDPHNLGACLRSADAAGVQGVVLTKDNAVGITPTVCKVASGAAETVPVYQVTNLARTLRWLKKQNIWILGAAGEARDSVYQIDLTMPLAIVIGAEGKGLRRLTREACDILIKLPMAGQVQSLNLSVAAGIMLYETVRQRAAQASLRGEL